VEKKQEDSNEDEPTKTKSKKRLSRQGRMLNKAHPLEAQATVEGEVSKKSKRNSQPKQHRKSVG